MSVKRILAKIKSKGNSRQQALAILAALIVTVIGFIALVATHAATNAPIAFESENTVISGNASQVTDGSASGGKAIKFQAPSPTPPTPPPPPGGGCPAYPAFPDANCTGVPAGTTLHSCSGSLAANTTYDSCLFSGGVTATAHNVIIKNSKILGVVGGNYDNALNLTMTDVEIDGQNSSLDATNGLHGYNCTRCKVHNAAKGFTGSNFTVTDSYVYDLYGEHDCNKYPGDCISHNEAILGSTGNIVVEHTNLVANFSPASTGGGMSAVIALYTHTSFWGPMDNVLVEKTRIESSDAGYCVYGGYSADRFATNVRFLSNDFYNNPSNGQCGFYGPITGWHQGGGDVWTGNVFLNSNGSTTTFPEPSSSHY